MQDIVNAGGSPQNGVLSIDDLPRNTLQSIIQRLNQKSQRTTKIFSADYDLNINSLKQVSDKIHQEFNGRDILFLSATVSLSLSNGARHDFASWEEFDSFDTSQAARTKAIAIEVTADILDSDRTPQRFKTQISIQNTPRAFGLTFGPISFQRIEDFGIPPVPIHATVEYSDFIVGKNLIGTIDGWEDALKKRDPTFFQKLSRQSERIRNSLTFITTLSAIYLCATLPDIFSASLYTSLIASAGIIYVGHNLGLFFAKKVEENIDRSSTFSNITLTDGDRNHNEKVEKRNRSAFRKALGFLSFCVLQVALSVVANPVWEYLSS
ncbi:hypothetical protein [Paracoccus salsus]|uniref:hypothetical protein n=1 Tax=Paracoccus salsus TaxID=2911061 RepID=UPI001F2A863C|nr:hypothetical protein [Paracoccus salsus]MCF3974040.1 hypothetical protein [Paracoccus salsus]